MLSFVQAKLEDKSLIDYYMQSFGESSCQHSFVSMFSMYEKYGEEFFEDGNYLYIFRKKLSDDKKRVYLAPIGTGNIKEAYEKLIADAHSNGKKAEFRTVTECQKLIIEKEFPQRFYIEEYRDYFEYIYNTEKLTTLDGSDLKNKRRDFNAYIRRYSLNTKIKEISSDDSEDILQFERYWLKNNSDNQDYNSLKVEARMIEKQLSNWRKLDLFGIIVYVDDVFRGFCYGTELNKNCFDTIVEKADLCIPNIYRFLFQKVNEIYGKKYKYVNIEEDIGIEGLRKAKLSYRPDILLKKYIIREK